MQSERFRPAAFFAFMGVIALIFMVGRFSWWLLIWACGCFVLAFYLFAKGD